MRLNCENARKIDLIPFLIDNGFTTVKETRSDTWFISPFRSEKTASFKVSKTRNRWFDFGEGIGGNTLDFVIKFKNCSIQDALEILSHSSFSFPKPDIIEDVNLNGLVISETQLMNPALLQYLKYRCINLSIARIYCSEIVYRFQNNRTYFAIGFKNNIGGFELRNKYFKGCIGNKDHTLIKNGKNAVSIFESFSDFLSFLTMKWNNIDSDYLILNSTSMIHKVDFGVLDYQVGFCYLDNDKMGDKATNFILEKCEFEISDCRKMYSTSKDVNSYLMSKSKLIH